MKRWCVLLLTVLAVAFVGCGTGNDSATETETTAAKAQPTTPPVVADIARRLQAAGIHARATALNEGKAEIEVKGAEIVYYADASEAAKEGTGLEQVATGHPQKAMADAYGQVIVWTANEKPLTSTQRARFEEISKIVDPQR
ncbi:MAG TPA: hypothetical protein VFI09_00895 [Solirubrobacterales bacterium]|nr:hypothetical protein [Solirubrobacterales bacterium]